MKRQVRVFVEGQIYTITRVVRMGLQNNKFGVLLKEVKLSSESFPYELYDADRFIIIDELLKSEQEETILEKEVELNIIWMEDYNKEDVIASLKQLPQHLRTRSLVDQRSYLIGILAYRFGMSEPQIADILGFKRSKINYNKKIVMQFYGDKMFQANVYVYAQMYPFDFSVIETVQQVQRNKR